MTTPDLERRIRTWFADESGQDEPAPTTLQAFLAGVPQSVPREPVLLGRRVILLAAAAMVIAALGGAIAVGTGLIRLPSVAPNPPPNDISLPPGPSDGPTAPQLVAYSIDVDGAPRLWAANSDGTDAREVFPGDSAVPLGWSADGYRLLYLGTDSQPYVYEAIGGQSSAIDVVCEGTCSDTDFALAPDGQHLAFSRVTFAPRAPHALVAVMDLESGSVVPLEATSPQASLQEGESATGGVSHIRWSADGTRLLYVGSNSVSSEACGHGYAGGVFTVDPDGSDLLTVLPPDRCAWSAEWSPDGRAILFSTDVPNPDAESELASWRHDVYWVEADGSGLRRLTTDGFSSGESWTRDGRIVFARIPIEGGSPSAFELWAMDADGANPERLDPADLAQLTAAGCVTCPYPVPDPATFQDTARWPVAFWQPRR